MFAITLALTLSAAPNAASTAFFAPAGPLAILKIDVDAENLAVLKKEPRQAVRCSLRMGKETYADVGIHLKGQVGGSFKLWDDKPALTLNMDKFKKGQTFHGMDKFHLNNSVEDPSYLNELLCGSLFRAASVPAPRATHALVELNGRRVGLYVFMEGFDKYFLQQHFKNIKGNLYDGGLFKDVDNELILNRGMDTGRKELKDLAAASRLTDHSERLAALEQRFDVPKFYVHWCVDMMCCGNDGYAKAKNNFRIYYDPDSKKLTMFAHGRDEMFGDPKSGLFPGWNGLLARKLYETDAGRKRYREELKRIFAAHFGKDAILKTIDDSAGRLKEPLNTWKSGDGDRYTKVVNEYRQRVQKRLEYLQTELAK